MIRKFRRNGSALLLVGLLTACATPGKIHQVEPVAAINAEDGVALRGYDPVAYFTSGRPTPGVEQFATQWRGATWKFASAGDRDAFVADPEHYAPQYGGFCAFAVAHGGVADADPEAWAVVDDKLYVNFNGVVASVWDQDRPTNIAAADQNWPLVPKLADATPVKPAAP